MSGVFERHAFVAVTSSDLAAARRFWVEILECGVLREEAGHYFMVDAGGVHLCVDTADGDLHRPGSTDPVIGLRVAALEGALSALAARGLRPERGPEKGRDGLWALLRDPDGRPVVLTECD